MTRWLAIGLTVLGFALALIARGPGLLAIGLLMAVVGLFTTVMVLASERISSRSRPESAMLSPEALAALRARAAEDKRREAAIADRSAQASLESARSEPPRRESASPRDSLAGGQLAQVIEIVGPRRAVESSTRSQFNPT